jgi:hypothetical protein
VILAQAVGIVILLLIWLTVLYGRAGAYFAIICGLLLGRQIGEL